MQEQIDMRGALSLVLTNRAGEIVHEQHRKNRIVRTGRELVAHFFAGTPPNGLPPSRVTHIGVGTGTADPIDDDKTLIAERLPRKAIAAPAFLFIDETAADASKAITKRVSVEVTSVLDFTDANDPNTPLCEAGIFTADKDGIMYNRVTFNPVFKTDAFQLTLRWTITF